MEQRRLARVSGEPMTALLHAIFIALLFAFLVLGIWQDWRRRIADAGLEVQP